MSNKRKREEEIERLIDLPPHWLQCPNQSLTIADRFVCFKTPIDGRFDCNLESNQYFPPRLTGFSSECSPDNSSQVIIGLWIDLTEDNPYYKSDDIKKLGCKYVNIPFENDSEVIMPFPDPSSYMIITSNIYIIKHSFFNRYPAITQSTIL